MLYSIRARGYGNEDRGYRTKDYHAIETRNIELEIIYGKILPRLLECKSLLLRGNKLILVYNSNSLGRQHNYYIFIRVYTRNHKKKSQNKTIKINTEVRDGIVTLF